MKFIQHCQRCNKARCTNMHNEWQQWIAASNYTAEELAIAQRVRCQYCDRVRVMHKMAAHLVPR